jgi:hypothetical protein
VTNAGNELRSSKAAKLSQTIGIPVKIPFRLFNEYLLYLDFT